MFHELNSVRLPPKGALDQPERALRGFAKTERLAPDATQTVTFQRSAAPVMELSGAKR